MEALRRQLRTNLRRLGNTTRRTPRAARGRVLLSAAHHGGSGRARAAGRAALAAPAARCRAASAAAHRRIAARRTGTAGPGRRGPGGRAGGGHVSGTQQAEVRAAAADRDDLPVHHHRDGDQPGERLVLSFLPAALAAAARLPQSATAVMPCGELSGWAPGLPSVMSLATDDQGRCIREDLRRCGQGESNRGSCASCCR
jgi:hypothetical protein